MKKAQSSTEFLILFGAILFFFTIFLVLIYRNISDVKSDRENLLVKDVAQTVQDELNIAKKASNGYSRTFKLPVKIAGKTYTAIIADGLVEVRTKRHAIALPVPEIVGNLDIDNSGTDYFKYKIEKSGGRVYLAAVTS